MTESRTGTLRALVCVSLIVWLACHSLACVPRTDEDIERLRRLKETYGGKYKIALDGERYLEVYPKGDAPVNKDELTKIYKTFFLDDDGKPRESSIYTGLMNYYGPGHEFYQLEYYQSEDRVKIRDFDRY